MNIITSFFTVRKVAAALSLGTDLAAVSPSHPAATARQREYDDCVIANSEVPEVRRLVLLVEDSVSLRYFREQVWPRLGQGRSKVALLLHPKSPAQPTYADLFITAQRLCPIDSVCMVCNSDIYVKSGFALQEHMQLLTAPPPTAFALTRYETESMEAPLIDEYRGSHDAFLFTPRTLTPGFVASVDHVQNAYKSENIVIHELQRSGVTVRNPCRRLHVFHRHAADVRQWFPPVDEERYGRAFPE